MKADVLKNATAVMEEYVIKFWGNVPAVQDGLETTVKEPALLGSMDTIVQRNVTVATRRPVILSRDCVSVQKAGEENIAINLAYLASMVITVPITATAQKVSPATIYLENVAVLMDLLALVVKKPVLQAHMVKAAAKRATV
ncbi:hypothetical protein NDU88_001036 [Pleurodeles waltl]|uniref:Uncharacterized protein n=1 Tax=Pleurodeles waltl TaxID=8319 RepID=A0AAV7L8B7_PLEWA|nr:hypothetical protein NDU88_001036 [Pleurodeles waltl]